MYTMDPPGVPVYDDDDDAEESYVSEPSSLQLDELMPSDSLPLADPSTSLDAVPVAVHTTPVVFIGDVHDEASQASAGSLMQFLRLGGEKGAPPPQTPQKLNDDVEEQGGEKVANRGLTLVLSNTETEPESPEKLSNTAGGAAPKTACCNRRGYAIVSALALIVLVIVIPLIVLDVGGSSSSKSNVLSQEQGAGGSGNSPVPAPVPAVLQTLSPTNAPTSPPSVSATPTAVQSSVPSVSPSSVPSSGPSGAASAGPSFVPSAVPSLLPSSTPSVTASDSPSSAPSPTPTSPFPTRPPLDLFGLLSTATPIDVLQDTTTAQYSALRWLETADGRSVRTESEILQRYALVVLDFSLHTSRLATSINEFFEVCSWPGVGCSDGLTVTSLNWANSGLDGELPAEMGLLRNLTRLDLAENQIGGTLPDALYDLTELESLYLHQNKLTGSISDRIENLYGLVNLYLSNNELSGGFPANLGSLGGGQGNRPLRILTLHENKFSGAIPRNLNLRFLYYLDLSNNQFTGSLPADWGTGTGTLVRIRHFHVDNNRFTGQIPLTYPAMGNGRIEQFTVNDNSFVGVMPGNWPLQNHMSSMEMQNNFFSSLGSGVCNLIVFEGGEVVNFDADCEICNCRYFCDANQCF